MTLNYISFPSHYLPSKISGPCNGFYCLGHYKNVYDDDDDDDDDGDGDDGGDDDDDTCKKTSRESGRPTMLCR